MRQDNLGPPLVQISATTLVFVSFLFVICGETFITFHMSPLSSTSLSTLGQLPDNFYLYRRSGLFICPSPLPFGSRKATCSVYSSTPRLGFPRRFFIHFYSTFFSLRHLSLDYSLLHCVSNNRSISACFSPQSRYSTSCNLDYSHTSYRTASIFPFRSIPDTSYGANPLSTLAHIPSKQSRQCRA